MSHSSAGPSPLVIEDLGNRLAGHPFSQLILDAAQPAFEEAVTRIQTSLRETGELPPRSRETDEDSYFFVVSRRTMLLLSRVGRLTDSARLLLSTPGAAYLRRVEVDRASWMEYHYSNYVVSLASIGDICLLLTSGVFALGLIHRHCTSDIVKNNRHVRNTDSEAALDKVESIIREHRSNRNLYLHRGESVGLDTASGTGLFSHLQMLSLAERITPTFEHSRELSQLFSSEARALAPVLSEELDTLATALETLLSALLPVVKRNLTSNAR